MIPFIYNRVKTIAKKTNIRFCMPSHIGKPIGSVLDGVFGYDITELEDSDNLNNPKDIILKSLDNAKKIVSARNAAFITTGASAGIKAMLFLACSNSKIIVDRFSHHSVIDAIALCNITPIFTTPTYIENIAIPLPPTSNEIEKLILKDKDVKAVVITSPNYYGQDANLPEIYKITTKYSVKLLVDNSHGTHYLFLKNPPYKISSCADMWVNSAHKTLPVLTGGAIIFSNYIKSEELTRAVSLFSTSSPSYLILASLDYGLCYAFNKKEKFEKAIENVEKIKIKLESIGYNIVKTSDKLRLVIKIANAKNVLHKLYKQGIACEMADENYIVLIVSPLLKYNELNSLAKSLYLLYNKRDLKIKNNSLPIISSAVSPREAMFRESETIDIITASGRICAECVTIYPPSVPIIIPGEIITKEVINCIKKSIIIDKIKVVKGII